MYPPRISVGRLIPLLHSPRPSDVLKLPCHPRLFTQNSQLLLISPASPRPQLPFLHNPSGLRPPRTLSRNQFQVQLSRLLTTERKRYFKDQVYLAVKWSVYGWTAFGLVLVIIFGIDNERLERKHPSPSEWSWRSRLNYRAAHAYEDPSTNGNGLVDWASAGNVYQILLRRLEDAAIDGNGLRPALNEEGDIYVEGVGKTGLDISAKSEPWRRGYYLCLMGAARAAEHLDGWVRDTTRSVVFPPEFVIGPSNPRPKPVPYGVMSAPLEENCERAFEPPETYYMKALTTQGFSTRQRLDAALAYADWLDFKGLPSSAEDMYDWALDIAMGGLPVGVDNAVNTKTGVINEHATYITPNIILATTSLATHHARNNNLSTALPIFLSVLRAQRKLAPPSPVPQSPLSSNTDTDLSTIPALFSLIRSFLTPPSYPPTPPSGDTPATRNPTVICEEAGIMAQIGEILFASSSTTPPATPALNDPILPSASSSKSSLFSFSTTSPSVSFLSQSQQAGLSWTRSAVSLAEETLLSLSSSPPNSSSSSRTASTHLSHRNDTDARTRCSECLNVGISNWKKMVAKLQKAEAAEREKASSKLGVEMKKNVNGSSERGGWFWNGGSGTDDDEVGGEGRWEREGRVVEEKARVLKRLLREEGLGGEDVGGGGAGGSGGMLFG